MSATGAKGGRRIPTPMPPPRENMQARLTPRLVGSEASYKLSSYEQEALNAVKATAPKMDRNGYFFYVTATAKKKKISLMQPKPPRVAFTEEKRRPGVAERVFIPQVSVPPAFVEYGREMAQRGPSPSARLYTQLESYQPRYHTIRENSDKRVDSDVRRRRKDQRIVYPQSSSGRQAYKSKLTSRRVVSITNMSFANKVVIVTGGSSGIGAATARHFAKKGAEVTIVGRNEIKLNNVAAQISKFGKKPLIINANVSKDEEIKTIVKRTVGKFGKLDVLINNAGICRSASLGDENFLEVYDEVVNTNLRSIFVLSNLATPHLIKTKGNIVNISSVAGSSTLKCFVPSGNAAYCVSKAGLDHFSRVAAMELAAKGVRVNAVSPGPVETPILENSGIDATWDEVKKITALQILTQSDEIADLILYLASDKAKSVTGSNYVIDGGLLVN